MGLSSKHYSGDQGLEWGNTFRQREAAGMSIRRQQPQPQQSEMLKCPRCSSTNTKFCYYNNYNKSQPRHFCKSCKRHWTKGGTLRNVPVGGGRKNKRPKVSKPASATARVPATSRQDFPSIPLSSGEKNASSILYQTMIGRSSVEDSSISEPFVGNSAGLSAAAAHQSIPYTEFQLSSLSTFDMNASLNPSSFQPLSVFNHFGGNIDSVEESTITTVNVPGSSGAAPWGGESSSTLDLPSYWNWNEIDVLTSGDLSISWDDQDNRVMKP